MRIQMFVASSLVCCEAQCLIEEDILEKFLQKQEFAKPHIGTDEAGKGDYFGPLVVAGVFVDNEVGGSLRKEGVVDSKQLSDSQIGLLAKSIKRGCIFDVVVVSPKRYNQLHAKMGNINLLLAWAHARVIENLLGKAECGVVLSDQFGEEHFLEEKLMEKGQKVDLIQRPRAEEDVAVAAASILARDEYLKRKKKLSEKHGVDLPGGSGKRVVETGKLLTKLYGRGILPDVAKVHFKTTAQIL
ncbi:ribonuclease HIII [Candidatus Altiarchaeota archaeon]